MSELQPLRINYLQCSKKNHQGQYMNYICLSKICKEKGLICSMCRQNHAGHDSIPLKFLLMHLKTHNESPMAIDDFTNRFEEIDNIKNCMLYDLRRCVESLAKEIQNLEQSILDTYQTIKIELLQQIELNMNFNQIISNALDQHIKDEKLYKQNFSKIAGWIDKVSEKELKFKIDLEDVVTKLKVYEKDLYKKTQNIQTLVKNQIEKTGEASKKQQEKKINEIVSLPPKIHYTFSSTFKASSVTLNATKLLAKQGSGTGNGRFILVEQGKGLKNQSITFKIPHLQNWVGVGICVQTKIAAVSYQFKYENLGHGSYLLSNNGYTWSSSVKEDNIHSCGVSFTKENTVEVILTPHQLIYKIKDGGSGNVSNTLKMAISIKEEEWPHVCFCANLCSPQDSVEIIN